MKSDDAKDSWYTVATLGDYLDSELGVIERIDASSIKAILGQFNQEAARPNWAGLLVDSDRNSLHADRTSAAMGWGIEMRVQGGCLEVQITWTAIGSAHVEGRSLAHLLPFFDPETAVKVGEKKLNGKTYPIVRPLRLDRLSLTNRIGSNSHRLTINRQGSMRATLTDTTSAELAAKRILNRALSISRKRAIPFSAAWRAAALDLRGIL